MTLTFFSAFLVFGCINFIASILVLRGLAAAGVKTSFFELRWQVHKHLKSYKRNSLAQSGSVAWPYYGYWVSLIGMLGCAILTLSSLSR